MQRIAVHKRLESRARLASRLRGAIEATGHPFVAADQGAHFTRARVERDQRRFGPELELSSALPVGESASAQHAHAQRGALARELTRQQPLRVEALFVAQSDATEVMPTCTSMLPVRSSTAATLPT